MAEVFEGGCFCGKVRYRMTSRPMFVHCCHCRDCQKQSGGAFAINALLELDRIEMLAGEPEAWRMKTESGRPHHIYRCPDCAAAVWSDYGGRPMRFVRVATLDEPAALQPDVHIFTRSKLPWVDLSGGAPVFEVYYDMAKQWPADSLARRRALLGDV